MSISEFHQRTSEVVNKELSALDIEDRQELIRLLDEVFLLTTLPWKPLPSSNLKQVAYDQGLKVLKAEFQNGGLYQYTDVPSEVYQQLLEADSHGSFFSRKIARSYNYVKING